MSDGPTFARIDQGSNDNDNNNDGNNTDNTNFDPWNTGGGNGDGTGFTETQIEGWRERERRQRSIRSFMMFLLMMMLMDGEDHAEQRRQRRQQKIGGLRGGGNIHSENINNINTVETDMELYRARRTQDLQVEAIILNGNHSRINRLIERNNGKDFDKSIRSWAREQRNIQTRVFYEQLLKDLVLEQPDGSYVKVLVASASNNEAVTVASNPSKILLDAVSTTSGKQPDPAQPVDDLKHAVKQFDEFLEAEQEIWHYPWNITGYYRGDWKLLEREKASSSHDEKRSASVLTSTTRFSSPNNNSQTTLLSPVEAELPLLDYLQTQKDPSIGVHLLPPGMELLLSNNRTSNSVTKDIKENVNMKLRGATSATESSTPLPEKLTLTKTSGKIAFQLYSKAIPAMKELSLVRGYIKVCDSNTVGYSTSKDVLLKVHGVLVHSLGRLSLIANPRTKGRVALLVGDVNRTHLDKGEEETKGTEASMRRRLQDLLSLTSSDGKTNIDDSHLEEIRDHTLELFHKDAFENIDLSSYQKIRSLEDEDSTTDRDLQTEYIMSQRSARRRLDSVNSVEESATNVVVGKEEEDVHSTTNEEKVINSSKSGDKTPNLMYSKNVIPFPFAWDDQNQSLQRNRAPISVRNLSVQEKSLEINAGSCEFEINMYVREEKWTVGQWKKLMTKYTEQELVDSSLSTRFKEFSTTMQSEGGSSREDIKRNKELKKSSSSSGSKSQRRSSMEQAWIMAFNGTIKSPNCNFEASVNSTAIRTDWETTTGKAINYSFYMMTICLTQIVLLLRQLLHTQSQSASTRVSLLCIGWQTVIDALLCLVHIYLSLAMQPLFTAFASVAFFKLLIFCVIEMKYMAIIIQARNASNGGNSVELLRRQIAMLHVRFYVALMGSCLGFFYSNNYRTLYMLLLYSFWVPQIIHNVVTEAKKPMHPYYLCGMSVTRLVAPLYMFANQGNFLKEVYPESPINIFMCQLLVLWVSIQSGILYAQSHLGARFFIPAQFLPPKYDYHRPVPASLLSPDDEIANPTEQLQKERELPKTEVRSLVVSNRDLNSRGSGARNRKEGNRVKGETVMTAETLTQVPTSPGAPSCIECSICYNNIDTTNREAYMIAPCNHIFHRECLQQWMDVKMECPICRLNLPAP